MMGTRTIDNFGNLLENGQPIGYYDSGKCYLLSDNSETSCPDLPQNFAPAEIKATPTYYWVALLVFCALVIFIAWWINR